MDERLEAAEETPEPPAVPVVALGELWLLGNHRLIIGDSTDAPTVERLLDGAKPHMMVTNPPYGVEYDPAWRSDPKIAAAIRHPKPGAIGKVGNNDRANWSAAWALYGGDVAYVWHAGNMAHTVADSLIGTGLNIRAQIIWAKHRFVLGRGNYHPQHEPCWYAVRKGRAGRYGGGRTQSTLWAINAHQKSETGHSTQKPIECMRQPILNNSKPGNAVYDPFCGSGTTLIAAEMEKRRCFAVKLDPVYAEVIIARWQNFTKKDAARADGATLEDLRNGKTARRRLRELKTGKTKLVQVSP